MGRTRRAGRWQVVVCWKVSFCWFPDADHGPNLNVCEKCCCGGSACFPFLDSSGSVFSPLDISTDLARLEFAFHAVHVLGVHRPPIVLLFFF